MEPGLAKTFPFSLPLVFGVLLSSLSPRFATSSSADGVGVSGQGSSSGPSFNVSPGQELVLSVKSGDSVTLDCPINNLGKLGVGIVDMEECLALLHE